MQNIRKKITITDENKVCLQMIAILNVHIRTADEMEWSDEYTGWFPHVIWSSHCRTWLKINVENIILYLEKTCFIFDMYGIREQNRICQQCMIVDGAVSKPVW